MSTAAAAALDVDALRAQFPALSREVDGKRLVYLDSACTALKPKRVADRLADFYANWGGCGGKRSTHLLSQRVEEWFASSRRTAALFLRADGANEIVFTSGTTEAANLIARAFPYESGRREVVITDLEHNAVALPFLEAARRGEIELRICRTEEGRLDLNRLEALLSQRTALLAITHASNVMGGVLPVAEAAKLARRAGARTFVDDAQYLGTHREDVSTLGADFVAFSGHKVGAPFGVGVLWGREQELNRLNHYKVGGGTIKSLAWDGEGTPEPAYLDAPMRLEAGVPDFGGALGLDEALKAREELPQAALRAHVGALARLLAAGLARVPQVRVLGRPEDLEKGSLVSFVPEHPEFSPVDFNLYLNHELPGRFVAVRVGEHCAHLLHRRLNAGATVRASLGAYNTAEEVDVYLDAVRSYAAEACGG
ncbi:MAG TPA: aminotransferase class V-fold PLP-dependent enzyme [Elusimicrobiota bacterium]|nr:aminotransferase class V-fold PLP-dependent enzyme [Elusimicrobiota bacterium]